MWHRRQHVVDFGRLGTCQLQVDNPLTALVPVSVKVLPDIHLLSRHRPGESKKSVCVSVCVCVRVRMRVRVRVCACVCFPCVLAGRPPLNYVTWFAFGFVPQKCCGERKFALAGPCSDASRGACVRMCACG